MGHSYYPTCLLEMCPCYAPRWVRLHALCPAGCRAKFLDVSAFIGYLLHPRCRERFTNTCGNGFLEREATVFIPVQVISFQNYACATFTLLNMLWYWASRIHSCDYVFLSVVEEPSEPFTMHRHSLEHYLHPVSMNPHARPYPIHRLVYQTATFDVHETYQCSQTLTTSNQNNKIVPGSKYMRSISGTISPG